MAELMVDFITSLDGYRPSPMSQAAVLSRLGDENQYRIRSVTLCECSWQAGPGSSGDG
jgi:hypothetical protein